MTICYDVISCPTGSRNEAGNVIGQVCEYSCRLVWNVWILQYVASQLPVVLKIQCAKFQQYRNTSLDCCRRLLQSDLRWAPCQLLRRQCRGCCLQVTCAKFYRNRVNRIPSGEAIQHYQMTLSSRVWRCRLAVGQCAARVGWGCVARLPAWARCEPHQHQLAHRAVCLPSWVLTVYVCTTFSRISLHCTSCKFNSLPLFYCLKTRCGVDTKLCQHFGWF